MLVQTKRPDFVPIHGMALRTEDACSGLAGCRITTRRSLRAGVLPHKTTDQIVVKTLDLTVHLCGYQYLLKLWRCVCVIRAKRKRAAALTPSAVLHGPEPPICHSPRPPSLIETSSSSPLSPAPRPPPTLLPPAAPSRSDPANLRATRAAWAACFASLRA